MIRTQNLFREYGLPCAVACVYGILIWSGAALTSGTGRISAISFANGLLLGFLLADVFPRQRIAFATAFIANLIANTALGDPAAQALALALCNSLEVGISYMLLRQAVHGPAELFTPQVLLRFVRWAILAAPLLGSVLAAAFLASTGRYEFLASFERRFLAHGLGIAVVTPMVLGVITALNDKNWRLQSSWRDFTPYVVLLACTIAIFSQRHFPLLFLVFPPLIWAVFKHRYVGAAIGVAMVAGVSVTATILQNGPLMLIPESTVAARVLMLQLLLATCVVTVYPICAMLERQRKLLASVAQNEQRLRVLADNSRDVIIHTLPDSRRTYVSPAIYNMFGYTPEETLSAPGVKSIHRDDRAMFEAEEAKLAAGADGTECSYRVRHRDGHFVWAEVTAKTLRDDHGNVTGWISVTRDISERKRIEQMKADFIATVSHELRTPVTAIAGALSLAQSGKFGDYGDGIARLLKLASTNSQRLSLLVNDILDLEKLSAGKLDFDMRPIDVDRVLEDAALANEPYAQKYKVTYRLGEHSGATIDADPHRLQQVLSNLLSNAAKFSPEGSEVVVSAQQQEQHCVIRVIDHGSGIPAAFQPQLFERFSQADPPDGRARAGTGLGMAIAKELTEGMGGAIAFESREGVGTTFTLTFALLAPNAAA